MRTIVAGIQDTSQFTNVLFRSNYGKERREKLLEIITTLGKLAVNGNYLLQTNQDLDLKYLLKHDKIKIIREGVYIHTWSPSKKNGKRQSYVVVI